MAYGWIMLSFTLRSARPYMKYCSYSTRIQMMTRKRRPLTAPSIHHTVGYVALRYSELSCGGKILVSVYDWPKHGFGNTRGER